MNKYHKSVAVRLSAAAVVLLAVAGCSDIAEERHFPAMPKELADCRVFYLQNSKGNSLSVVRCPHSTTTTKERSGKSDRTVVTIDGVEYAPVKE